ncbi:MAG: hypothetical protein V3V05_00295 [Pontiella sp.]
MNNEHSTLMEAIQSSGYKAAIVVAGGGSGATHALLSHPGASRFILEVQIPYSPRARFDYLGETLGHACSEDAAKTLAGRAFERASIFCLTDESRPPILGVSCTAALKTNRERKGKDRAYICIKARKKQVVQDVIFDPDKSRAEQEEHLTAELFKTLANFLGIDLK